MRRQIYDDGTEFTQAALAGKPSSHENFSCMGQYENEKKVQQIKINGFKRIEKTNI